jgi:hypothetical protein
LTVNHRLGSHSPGPDVERQIGADPEFVVGDGLVAHDGERMNDVSVRV